MKRLWLSVVPCLLIVNAAAQEKASLTLIDTLGIPGLSSPVLSADGNQVAYILRQADWKANKRTGHIWRVSTAGGEPVQLTNGENGESSPRWSPDGRFLAFLAKRGQDEHRQLYLLGQAGEAQRLTQHRTAPGNIEWSPDGSSLYFLASDPPTDEEKKKKKLKDDVFAFDENYEQRHLWKVAVDGGEAQRITDGDYSILSFSLSGDGSRIVVHRGPTPLFDNRDESDVWTMESDGTSPKQLTQNTVTEQGARLSPDNRTVLFICGCNDSFETYYNRNLFLISPGESSPRLLMPDQPFEVRSAAWSRDGRSIFFAANLGLRNELFRIDLDDGRVRQLTDGKHSLGSWSYSPDLDTHLLRIAHTDNPGEIWTMTAGRTPKRLTRVFSYISERFRIPRQEGITWTSPDGAKVEGLLFYPIDYQDGQRYPLIVWTHGGPAASDKYGFPSSRSSIPKMTAMGYAVLKPNYRGSTGYGDVFLRDMVGHYFRNAHLDVMAGVDHLIEIGLADPERLVKMGWSAGGHMTNKIITFTDRFKAASSGAGAVNWVSMYGQSDVRTYRTPWFGGSPWQKNAPIDVYWENSPLSEIWKVKTPTLVLVGENDVRVPPPQSVELYRALKSNGVPTRLYIAPREPHGWRELRHQLFKMNVELDWFEKYAMGQDYQWEKAPGDEDRPKEARPTP